MVLYPLFVSFFLLLFSLIEIILKKAIQKVILERFLIQASIATAFFLSPIITSLSDFVNCTSVDNTFYITVNLIEECSGNSRYLFWRNVLVIPAFILFAICLPLLAFSYMYINKNRLYNQKIIYKIGFLLNGYTTQTFYW